ncbi:MAG: RHS repeat protein [Bdellovibrionales bacterium]|nr:RHS repeat protein [Bdellovibrionales bacterium]
MTYPLGAQEESLGWGAAGSLHYVHHAPDPVQTRNGNFFLPLQDYYLPCYGFPLEVYRSYNSLSTRQGPFGKGWTFNYDSKIAVAKAKGLRVVEADGFINEYQPIEFANADSAKLIVKIVAAKKNEDLRYMKNKEGKGKAFYQDFEKKLRSDKEFFDRQAEKYAKQEMYVSASGTYVSKNRGTTTIKEISSGYERSSLSGRTELYNKRGLLSRVHDPNQNELRFTYDLKSRLQRIYDGCKNYLHIDYNKDGTISLIKDSMGRSMSYGYQVQGTDTLLISMTSMDGKNEKYEYDKLGQMTKLHYQAGGVTEIVYDPKTRRVKSQIGPGTKKTDYEYGRDGKTSWCSIKDNQGENSKYEYVDSENTVSYTDRSGVKTTTILSTCCGKPVSVVSSNGIRDRFKYDDQGRVKEKTNASGQTTVFMYEPKYGYLERVISPNGDEVRYRYDKNGNLSYALKVPKDKKITPKSLKIFYEEHGKISRIEDQQNQEILFSYGPLGTPTKVEKKLQNKTVAQILVNNSKTGDIVGITLNPKQASTQVDIRNTLHGFYELLGPTGLDFEL